MSYFAGVRTLDEGKARYRHLARQHHPDLGGDTATMQAINAEWERVSGGLVSPGARDTFLAHIPTLKRSTATNWFLFPIRKEGARSPQAVLICVAATMRSHIAGGYNAELAATILEIIEHRTDEALAFAAWALAWEALPAEERDAIKRERSQEGRPPTEKQIAYLRSLGHRGAPPATMREASEAIDRLRGTRR